MKTLLCATLLLGAVSCRAPGMRAKSVGPPDLGLVDLAIDFPRAEEGQLSFTVDVPGKSARRVDAVRWELWLGPFHMATGVENHPAIAPQSDGSLRVVVQAPIVYRHLAWREGAAWLDVGVRGDVRLTGLAEPFPFRARKEVLAHGSPSPDQQLE